MAGVTFPGLPRTESEKLFAVFALLLGQLPFISHRMVNDGISSLGLRLFCLLESILEGLESNISNIFILQCIFYGYDCTSYTALDWPLPFPLSSAFSDASSLTYGGSSLYTSYLYALPV